MIATGELGAIAEASKAIGPIICVEPQEFLALLRRAEKPLVIQSSSGLFTKYRYLTSYKGLTFFTKSKEPLQIPGSAESIKAKKILIPQL